MATLSQLWTSGTRITTDMVRRESNHNANCYLSMGHPNPESSYKSPLDDGFINAEDIIADDWYIV